MTFEHIVRPEASGVNSQTHSGILNVPVYILKASLYAENAENREVDSSILSRATLTYFMECLINVSKNSLESTSKAHLLQIPYSGDVRPKS
jgi:hypothetical protein